MAVALSLRDNELGEMHSPEANCCWTSSLLSPYSQTLKELILPARLLPYAPRPRRWWTRCMRSGSCDVLMLPTSVPLRYTFSPELSMVAATCIQYAVSDSVIRL